VPSVANSEAQVRRAGTVQPSEERFAPLIWTLVVAAYLLAAIGSTPVGITIWDEVDYLAEAQAIREGAPLLDGRSYHPGTGENRPRFPLGWPLLLAPITRAPWPAPFALPVALHLLGTGLFARLLRKRGLSSLWALLYFAQPGSLLFSRTLMAESLSSALCVGMLLAADGRRAGILGLLAASSLVVKPSMALAAIPFVGAWLIFEVPAVRRLRAAFQGAAGALVPLLVWAWLRHANLAGAQNYFAWVTATPSFRHVVLVLVTFTVAWPGLPLSVLRARPSERAGAMGDLVLLLFYKYDYVGPSWAATLVVGVRLLLPAVIMLLPAYAALLSSLPQFLARTTVMALILCALTLPPLFMNTLASRRRVLDAVSSRTLRELRPGCAVGYTPFAVKLLEPFPEHRLLGFADEEALRNELLRGGCVDLLSPRAFLTTHEGRFEDPGFFASLTGRFPKCELERSGAERIVRLYPLGARASCD
jgi:hypothetical protein